MNFNLHTNDGVASFNRHLEKRSYAAGDGYVPTQLDAQLFETAKQASATQRAEHVHFTRWYKHIASFSDTERKQYVDRR